MLTLRDAFLLVTGIPIGMEQLVVQLIKGFIDIELKLRDFTLILQSDYITSMLPLLTYPFYFRSPF